jgi:PEP-CTERM motif
LSGGIILGQSQGVLSAVPEPGTTLLLAMGLVAIAGYHRRQR